MTRASSPLAPVLAYRWDLVFHLVRREFGLRYRRAFFGWLWAVGQPLARLVVLTLVFTRFLPLDIPDYAQFLDAQFAAPDSFIDASKAPAFVRDQLEEMKKVAATN